MRLALNGEPASPVLFPASLFPDLMGLKGKDGGSSLLSGRTAFALLKPYIVTQIDGCLRGLLADGVQVTEGFKCADVDPRGDASYINYISDKATSVGGGKIELFALDEARELLAGGKSRLVRYTMGGENSDTGMICGGAICLC